MASGSGDQKQNTGVFPAMQEYACSTGNNGVVYPQYGIGYSSGQNGAQGAYLQHQHRLHVYEPEWADVRTLPT